uniref:Uncharacterized protein n=1 Tax=Rhizophora mucronata TaxID=61149 RepID=A0A2P2IUH1_RHIMU
MFVCTQLSYKIDKRSDSTLTISA